MTAVTKNLPVVASIVGTRPQFIKLAALAPFLARKTRHIIVFTGQHYDHDLSEAVLDQLAAPIADENLRVGSGRHGHQTGRMLELCEKTLFKHQPRLVLVYGDTNTTLAGALAAVKLNIPVGHVEAGLRSGRRDMPEEINRIVTDHVASLLFYPTPSARRNLRREGIRNGLVASGDLMYELIERNRPRITSRKDILEKYGVSPGRYIMITLHRAENADDKKRLVDFINLLESIKESKLFLIHPRTEKNIRKFGLYKRLTTVRKLMIIKPQPYLSALALLYHSRAVLTDSGGIQKEAVFLGKACLTFRAETEWIETVTSGANVLVEMSERKVADVLSRLPRLRSRRSSRVNGHWPSAIIVEAIVKYLHKRP